MQVGDEAFQRAEEISRLRGELHGTVTDARLQARSPALERAHVQGVIVAR